MKSPAKAIHYVKPRVPVLRYKVSDALDAIRKGELTLLRLDAGHAELLTKKESYAVGWISRKQLEALEREMAK